MPIAPTDVAFMLSTKTASAGAADAQPDPDASLGKYVSTTVLSATALNNLFDDISGAENAASAADYRCIFVQNNHATLDMIAAKVWISNQVAGGASCQIAVDNIAASAKDSGAVQAAQIADETTAPASVGAFSSAASAGAALALGDIGPGQVRAIWVKRTAANSAALNNDGITLQVDFDTQA